jgi:hypothetical protein
MDNSSEYNTLPSPPNSDTEDLPEEMPLKIKVSCLICEFLDAETVHKKVAKGKTCLKTLKKLAATKNLTSEELRFIKMDGFCFINVLVKEFIKEIDPSCSLNFHQRFAIKEQESNADKKDDPTMKDDESIYKNLPLPDFFLQVVNTETEELLDAVKEMNDENHALINAMNEKLKLE